MPLTEKLEESKMKNNLIKKIGKWALVPLTFLALNGCSKELKESVKNFENKKFELELQDKLINRYDSLTNYSGNDLLKEYKNQFENGDMPQINNFTEFLYYKIDSISNNQN